MAAVVLVMFVTWILLMMGSVDTMPVVLRLNVINSTGRAKVMLPPAVSEAILFDTTSMSVRVSAFTVTVWFEANPVALNAAGVFVTMRQRIVTPGTLGFVELNRKYWLVASL